MPLYLLPCGRCWVGLGFFQRLDVSVSRCLPVHVTKPGALLFISAGGFCVGAAIVHLSPVLCPKCVSTGEMGREWPYSSLIPISFQGNTQHDKGSQSKTTKSSDLCRKQDSPSVGHRTNMDGGSLLIKLLFQCQMFRFTKQLLARDDSLLFNCCKLGVLAIIQHNSSVMLRGFH